MKTRRKVYVIKSLSWYYNDEVTIPGDARVVTAYARREDAERERLRLETEARRDPFAEASFGTTWDAERINAWLARFGVSRPANDLWNHWTWRSDALQIVGERWEEFCEMFDEPWFYHVIETELEV